MKGGKQRKSITIPKSLEYTTEMNTGIKQFLPCSKKKRNKSVKYSMRNIYNDRKRRDMPH